MSVVQTLLVFVAIPAAGYVLLAILVYGPSAGRAPRYRPGRGWSYEPVWYVPQPRSSPPASSGSAAVGAGASRPALGTAAGSAGPVAGSAAPARPATARGGASGSW